MAGKGTRASGGCDEDPLGVRCRKSTYPNGAKTALDSVEAIGKRGAGAAGESPHRIRRLVLALALVMLAFAATYPYLDATGSCGDPGCPEFSHAYAPAPAGLPAGVLAAVAAPPPAGHFRRPPPDRSPDETSLPPEPDPPRH